MPAGQTTQLIVGASGESDRQILLLTQGLYRKASLKRVYYSAYVPIMKGKNLPAVKAPPLMRENRLYQADWLLRFYHLMRKKSCRRRSLISMRNSIPSAAGRSATESFSLSK